VSDRQRSVTRRDNLKTIRREAEASASRQLDVVVRKLRHAASQGKTITLLPSDAEMIVRFYETSTSKRAAKVGAPDRLAEFHRWMARDVLSRRAGSVSRRHATVPPVGGGQSGKVAITEVAKEWQVSGAMVQKVVREYGVDAQDWLKRCGADRTSTAVVIAQWAETYRMLAIVRERKEEPTQEVRRDEERRSWGRMASPPPPGSEDAQVRANKIAIETGDNTYNIPVSVSPTQPKKRAPPR
jgi:transposase-like protein